MQHLPIKRMSASDPVAVRDYFDSGPAFPVIFTDATANWPARTEWTLEKFSKRFAKQFGFAALSFAGGEGGKAMTLGEFISHPDGPLEQLPGFWIDETLAPVAEAPEYSENAAWCFTWWPFKDHPELLDEMGPFPKGTPNIVEQLPPELYRLLQSISGRDFHSIYISRNGTVTPLHSDHSGTIGSLSQFDGIKRALLVPPADGAERNSAGQWFDPEQPDFEAFPGMRQMSIYSCELSAGDMLIIPPNWLHHVRSLSPSLTMSHNFFTHVNFAPYLAGMLEDIAASPDPDLLRKKIAKYLPHITRQRPE